MGNYENRIDRRNIQSIDQLKQIVNEVWDGLSIMTINKLIHLMNRRCREVLNLNGRTISSRV